MGFSRVVFFAVVLQLSLLTACEAQKGLEQAYGLSVGNGFHNPVGYHTGKLEFSWKIPMQDGTSRQSAYRIVAASDPSVLPDKPDIWDSGRVESEESVRVPYPGQELSSRQRIYWQVMYWNQDGAASEWSEKAYVETGLLSNSDWKASWISYPFPDGPDTTLFSATRYNVQYFRKKVHVDDRIASARLYVTSKGVYEPYLNGERIGTDIMAPGFTDYSQRIETLAYDVTDVLRKGDNILAFVVAPGWFTTRIGWSPSQYVEKGAPKLLCQLEVTTACGKELLFCSDGTWMSSDNGPVRFSEIYDGEFYDEHYMLDGWMQASYDDGSWLPAVTEPVGTDVSLVPKMHNTVRTNASLPSVGYAQSPDGTLIFDMGQNMVGVPRLRVPMKKGDTLVVRFSEMLKENGSLYTESYRTAQSTDYYVAARDGYIDYTPSFTFHGFRYVGLSGYDTSKKVRKDWVEGKVQHSGFGYTGHFKSSSELLNRLYSNIQWGHRGNSFDIPTDCPQRDERMGWTGDAQIFAPSAFYLADVHSFFSAWMVSMREAQRPDGRIPIVVPNVAGDRVSPGWGDAATVIPWTVYMMTGDTEILKSNYGMMKRWIDFYLANMRDGIICVKGFCDWLQPYSSNGNYSDTPYELVATAYCIRSIDLAASTAASLGYVDDVREYENLRSRLSEAYMSAFFDGQGKLSVKETQTGYILTLGFGIADDPVQIQGMENNLVRLVGECGNHLRTGFLGTPMIAPVLDRIGHPDLAVEVLFKETYPSWFFSILQGATTMWERWNSYTIKEGFGDANMNSFNHYAYGAVWQWVVERILGISPTSPAFRTFRIAPYMTERLDFAEGSIETPYGTIYSGWKDLGNHKMLSFNVPVNTTAEVLIPEDNLKGIVLNAEAVDIGSAEIVEYNRMSCVRMILHAGKYELEYLNM